MFCFSAGLQFRFSCCLFLLSARACCFQVVFTLVEPATDKYALPGDRLDATEWRRVFLETGGMRHLLDLLKQDSGIDPSQVLTDLCCGRGELPLAPSLNMSLFVGVFAHPCSYLRTFSFSFSVPKRSSDHPGSLGGSSPPSSLRYAPPFFVARRFQHFLSSSTTRIVLFSITTSPRN